MKIILLSGGAGKRLWPLSNSVRSKQFLKLLSTTHGLESMIQRMVRQIRSARLADEVIIATGANQTHLIEAQLGKNQTIVTEPARRDTLPAIYLASLYLFSKGVPEDETILVLPCDTYALDDFFSSLREVEKAVKNNYADIVLLGIKPTYPSSKYGYILPVDFVKGHSIYIPIDRFIEKPNPQKACELINDGALWNAEVYGFKLKYLLDLGNEIFKTRDYSKFRNMYSSLPRLSFSYDVLEKSNNCGVVLYEGNWKDIGTWNTLTSEMQNTELGNVASEDCTASYIINELNIPLISIGCENMVIVASYDGILVADREKTKDIKTPLYKVNDNNQCLTILT